MIIRCYDDFCKGLIEAGFSMGGGSDNGVFSLVGFDWNEAPDYDTPVRWHTGDPETDPWQWRIRVLNERSDIAYAKLFFGKSGYIAREWYPYFLAVRRESDSFEDDYRSGTVSQPARRIYSAIAEHRFLAVHDIKAVAGFGREDNSQFNRALVELQNRMYITICGEQPKIFASGNAAHWMSMAYAPAADFFDGAWAESRRMDRGDAIEAIKERIYALNPNADAKKVRKFIEG